MAEPYEVRLKRIRMRSMRRGIKEMDIILVRFADARLDTLSSEMLDLYDALLWENDQDLYQWVTGQCAAPDRFVSLVDQIAELVSARDV